MSSVGAIHRDFHWGFAGTHVAVGVPRACTGEQPGTASGELRGPRHVLGISVGRIRRGHEPVPASVLGCDCEARGRKPSGLTSSARSIPDLYKERGVSSLRV